MVRKERSTNTSPFVIAVRGLKQNIKGQLGCCSRYKFHSGKWDEIEMDYIVGLPRTRVSYNFIQVVVDRLTKVVHFIHVKTTYNGASLVELYISWIVCLHGVPEKIVSDRGTQFNMKFWQQQHEALVTQLNFSLAYHPQTHGQTNRINQIMEDMLRKCAIHDKSGWDISLAYVEFSYNMIIKPT